MTRAVFAEKFEELIGSCNTGSRNIEALFEELLKLSRNLSKEQQRYVRENITGEELVILDILKELGARGHACCRYADDCNIDVKSKRVGERVMASVSRFLAERLRLKVNTTKSAVA